MLLSGFSISAAPSADSPPVLPTFGYGVGRESGSAVAGGIHFLWISERGLGAVLPEGSRVIGGC